VVLVIAAALAVPGFVRYRLDAVASE
jgi:hypothetical protein